MSAGVFAQTPYIDSLYSSLQTTDDSSKVDIFLTMGDYYEYSNPDSALFFYKKAEITAKKCNNPNLIAQSLNFTDALLLIDTALSLTNDSIQIIYLKNNLATIYTETGLLNKAFSIYYEQLSFFISSNDSVGLSAAYSNFSYIFDELNLYDSSLFYLKKALEIDLELLDTFNIVVDYMNIGATLILFNKFDESEINNILNEA